MTPRTARRLDLTLPTTRRRPSVRLVVVLLTLGAAVARLYQMRFGYAHGVGSYDEGVYFGSAVSLTEGALPYRDFVLVHPPVLTLLFTPLAGLGHVIGTAQALGLAKIATALAGTASVPLTALLLRHRGLPTIALACGLVAFQVDAVASAYSPLLEPWVVLFCLLGAVTVFRGDGLADGRRLTWGGVLFGLACATKIWAFAPVLAVALVCLPGPRRRLVRLLGGVALGFGLPVLPFVVLAPGAFVHQVFVVQLFRAPAERTGEVFRLLHLFSVSPPDATLPSVARGWLVTGAVVVAVGLVLVSLRTVRERSPLDRFALLAGVLVVAMLFVPGTFYWHYAAFAAPFLAIAAALPLGRLGRRRARAWGAVLMVCVAGLAFTAVHRNVAVGAPHDEHVAFQAVVPAGSCVVTTKATLTIAADRYLSDDPDCPHIVDPFGTALAYTDGRPPTAGIPRNARLVALWSDAFAHADFVYVTVKDTRTIPDDPALRRTVATRFRIVRQPGLTGVLYERIR